MAICVSAWVDVQDWATWKGIFRFVGMTVVVRRLQSLSHISIEITSRHALVLEYNLVHRGDLASMVQNALAP